MSALFFALSPNAVMKAYGVTLIRFPLALLLAGFLAAAHAQEQVATGTPRGAGAGPLERIAREAVRANLALARERLLAERADHGVDQARALRLPSLTLDARYSRFDGVVNIGDFINPAYAALNQLVGQHRFPTNVDATLPFAHESRLRLAQPVFNEGARANHAIARALRGMQGAQLEGAMRQVAADAQVAWLAQASARRLVLVHDAVLPTLDEHLRVTQRLVDAGTATPEALARARAQRADVAQQRVEARQRLAGATRLFNFVAGRPLDAEPETIADEDLPGADTTGGLDARDADALVALALARREELRQVAGARDVARGQERLARGAFVPSVAVALDYGVQGRRVELSRERDFAVGSVILSWNLFAGGGDAARRQQALLDGRRAALQEEELRRQVALQVRQAHDAARAARLSLGAADERVAAARRTFALVARRWEEGVATHLEYVDARAQLTSAELNRVTARYAVAVRLVELDRAVALGEPAPR